MRFLNVGTKASGEEGPSAGEGDKTDAKKSKKNGGIDEEEELA